MLYNTIDQLLDKITAINTVIGYDLMNQINDKLADTVYYKLRADIMKQLWRDRKNLEFNVVWIRAMDNIARKVKSQVPSQIIAFKLSENVSI
jgi:hypothetical protein